MTIEGASAIVTGAGSGIGRATAVLLATKGARVLVADIDVNNAEKVAEGLREDGYTATAHHVDIRDEDQACDMVARAVELYGGLDIAVNNAGTAGIFAATADYPVDNWRDVVSLNLTGTFLCMRAEIPVLLAGGGGAIVNTSSAAGLMATKGMPAYIATKHAIVGLTRAAALEYVRAGIRINCVCPGTVRTPLFESFLMSEDAVAEMAEAMPIGRLATPEEIARAIVWLASSDSSYVVGHPLLVDGGVLAT